MSYELDHCPSLPLTSPRSSWYQPPSDWGIFLLNFSFVNNPVRNSEVFTKAHCYKHDLRKNRIAWHSRRTTLWSPFPSSALVEQSLFSATPYSSLAGYKEQKWHFCLCPATPTQRALESQGTGPQSCVSVGSWDGTWGSGLLGQHFYPMSCLSLPLRVIGIRLRSSCLQDKPFASQPQAWL